MCSLRVILRRRIIWSVRYFALFTISMSMLLGLFSVYSPLFLSSFLFTLPPFFFLIILTPLHRLTFNTSTMVTERPAMLISTRSSGPSDGPDRPGTSPSVRLNSFDSSLGCQSLSPFSSSLYNQHELSGSVKDEGVVVLTLLSLT